MAVSYYYASQNPTGAGLCHLYSFSEGIPYVTHSLSSRQRDALWDDQRLLPTPQPNSETLAAIPSPV